MVDAVQPGYLAYVDLSATMNGGTAGVSFAGSTITASYSAVNGPLPVGASVVLRFRAVIAAGLAMMLAVRAFLMDQLDREVVSTATSLDEKWT